ncbi:ATP-grasp domain-containing protein [Bacillus sp. TH44]|uniref:ATP-binding protein n=1 Tax=unclassified Bacillus (in: firmicutes) TaxID=185979 RepID=UPI001912A870|nr:MULTISPECIES: ATP-grasp domain-containing protein [unclassified Bacillus (in: firmicutes)]MBK5345633.1 ATP-grasp domain-containing protein [Bacillus sp. TH45]MBK5360429.1 ATP-grasp domain-containing protein [Bacillus sp. TH44]MBK5367324.1 ATP-grasp domain-containing protein [Bacillus sp. TH50]
MSFYKELKNSLSESGKNFIWLGNVEVEQHWKKENIITIPGSNISKAQPLVNKIGEMALFLAGKEDIVCLKEDIDEDYVQYIEETRGFVPNVMNFYSDNSADNISETILSSTKNINRLQNINRDNSYSLLPYGTSNIEEKVSQQTSISLCTPASTICREVNSKIYSWKLADEFDLRQVAGKVSHTISELEFNYHEIRKRYLENPLVLKDSMGVSGKGMVLIDSDSKFENILNLLKRMSVKKGHENIEMILENWIEKERDLNYQFIIDKKGNVKFTSVREALVHKGVHLGHKLPVQLTKVQEKELLESYEIIGKILARDGFYGVVGVDAMIDRKGFLYPCVEINARFNMATYQNNIIERFFNPHAFFMAIPFEVVLEKTVPFKIIKEELKDILYTKEKEHGVIINGFSTLNLGINKKGRLYTIIFGETINQCEDMVKILKNKLGNLNVT